MISWGCQSCSCWRSPYFVLFLFSSWSSKLEVARRVIRWVTEWIFLHLQCSWWQQSLVQMGSRFSSHSQIAMLLASCRWTIPAEPIAGVRISIPHRCSRIVAISPPTPACHFQVPLAAPEFLTHPRTSSPDASAVMSFTQHPIWVSSLHVASLSLNSATWPTSAKCALALNLHLPAVQNLQGNWSIMR